MACFRTGLPFALAVEGPPSEQLKGVAVRLQGLNDRFKAMPDGRTPIRWLFEKS